MDGGNGMRETERVEPKLLKKSQPQNNDERRTKALRPHEPLLCVCLQHISPGSFYDCQPKTPKQTPSFICENNAQIHIQTNEKKHRVESILYTCVILWDTRRKEGANFMCVCVFWALVCVCAKTHGAPKVLPLSHLVFAKRARKCERTLYRKRTGQNEEL